jgi:hypothetical protein
MMVVATKIKELAEQAFAPINDVASEGIADRSTFNMHWFQMYNQKFAELIVTECIGITDELVHRDEDGTWTSNELYTDYNGALFEVKRRIEQHFGVEE